MGSVTEKLMAKCETGVLIQSRTKVFYYFPGGEGGKFRCPQVSFAARQRIEECAGKHVARSVGIYGRHRAGRDSM